MAGDGVSLQTSLIQLGNVAKSQSRSQQAHAVPPGQNAAMPKDEVQPLKKVREADKAEKAKIDPDEERSRKEKENADGAVRSGEDVENDDERDEAAAAGLGGLVDIKA